MGRKKHHVEESCLEACRAAGKVHKESEGVGAGRPVRLPPGFIIGGLVVPACRSSCKEATRGPALRAPPHPAPIHPNVLFLFFYGTPMRHNRCKHQRAMSVSMRLRQRLRRSLINRILQAESWFPYTRNHGFRFAGITVFFRRKIHPGDFARFRCYGQSCF